MKIIDRLSPRRLLHLSRILWTTHGNANHAVRSGGRKPPHPFKIITGLLNKPISIPPYDINVQLTSAAWRNPATTPMRGWTIGTGIIELPVFIISDIGRVTPKLSKKWNPFFLQLLKNQGKHPAARWLGCGWRCWTRSSPWILWLTCWLTLYPEHFRQRFW